MNLIFKMISTLLIVSLLFPQKTYEFTEEEVKSLYSSIQELEQSDSLNQKIIENLNEQIYIYIQQTEIDSTIIENYKEQLELKDDMIKNIKPKWYDNKYITTMFRILNCIYPIRSYICRTCIFYSI